LSASPSSHPALTYLYTVLLRPFRPSSSPFSPYQLRLRPGYPSVVVYRPSASFDPPVRVCLTPFMYLRPPLYPPPASSLNVRPSYRRRRPLGDCGRGAERSECPPMHAGRASNNNLIAPARHPVKLAPTIMPAYLSRSLVHHRHPTSLAAIQLAASRGHPPCDLHDFNQPASAAVFSLILIPTPPHCRGHNWC
jgi:hypothetical protein